MYGYQRVKQEEVRQDGNSFLRRETVLREAQPDCDNQEGQRLSIEAIILDSANERTKEFILRRIRDVQKQKPTEGRLDRVRSLLLARFMVDWI